jgi:D-beta-D-heptose 7-phosphate kinase / D-beta-D-heptose 1-phosphate adenosyltransferase
MVLVIGDLMLDQYLDGEVNRISPEAPVPVLSVRKRRSVPGGAANAALNVAGLKAHVALAGIVGSDPAGQTLRELLGQAGVDADCLITVPSRPTTSKTRIISGTHQIVRLDEEITDVLHEDCERELIEKVVSHLDRANFGAVILSDYGKGVLSNACPQVLIHECRRRGIPLLVDPKRIDYGSYKGATCITPNQKEFYAAVAAAGISGRDFNAAGLIFQEQLQCSALLVTQGAEGMTLFTSGQAKHLPALAEEVFDVSGAGDTVVATLGVALGFGLDFSSAVELANAAASIVVRRAGTTPVAWADLCELLGIDAVYPSPEQSTVRAAN